MGVPLKSRRVRQHWPRFSYNKVCCTNRQPPSPQCGAASFITDVRRALAKLRLWATYSNLLKELLFAAQVF